MGLSARRRYHESASRQAESTGGIGGRHAFRERNQPAGVAPYAIWTRVALMGALGMRTGPHTGVWEPVGIAL